jgi:hypothetical protein
VAPTWLTLLAWISLASAFLCAGLIAADKLVRGYRQHMRIMDVVWPLTALYSGLLGWLAYRRWGRLNSPRYRQLMFFVFFTEPHLKPDHATYWFLERDSRSRHRACRG